MHARPVFSHWAASAAPALDGASTMSAPSSGTSVPLCLRILSVLTQQAASALVGARSVYVRSFKPMAKRPASGSGGSGALSTQRMAPHCGSESAARSFVMRFDL